MFNSLRHLLPDSTAWRLVVDRLLKQYLSGLSSVGTDTVAFVDDVSDDIWPPSTRELEEWEKQFGLSEVGSEATRRLALAAAWAATGGQSPGYIQGILRAAGFTGAYVYDAFDKTDVSLSKYHGNVFADYRAQDGLARGFGFAAGGRKMYIAGNFNIEIYQYSLSSPYDLSTVSYDDVKFDTSTEDADPVDVQLSPDGTKMFVLGKVNDLVTEYDLGTPFIVSTAVVVDSLDVTTQETNPFAFSWKPDGTIVYVTGNVSDQVHQYDLTTAWDISTASHTQSHDPSLTGVVGVTFTPDGAHMFLVESGVGICKQYDLSTPWDISTTGTLAHSFDMTTEDATPLGIVLEHGHLFMFGSENASAYRYTYGGPRNPQDETNQPLFGDTQCNDDGSGGVPIAECGEQPPNQKSTLSATCNRLFANEVWYLWNDLLTEGAPPPVPDDTTKWPHFWYVGGTPFGTLLAVSAADRARFERLCLQLGPTEQWIVTMLNVT